MLTVGLLWFETESSDAISSLSWVIYVPEEIVSFSLAHTGDASQHDGDLFQPNANGPISSFTAEHPLLKF